MSEKKCYFSLLIKKGKFISRGTAIALTLFLLLTAVLSSTELKAAESPSEDMAAASKAMQDAEKDFNQAERDFNQAMQGSGTQTTSTRSWSDMSSASTSASAMTNPSNPNNTVNPALQGSPETGYAGTWTDPATGDIITSVIAPTPQNTQNSQNYPIIIEPNVGSWDNSGNNGVIWGGGLNPQWPTTPDNPGWSNNPGFQPPYPSPNPPYPPAMGIPGQNYYPSPPLPPNFHPGYRPLNPPKPVIGNRPPFNPGMTPPPPPPPGGNWGSGPSNSFPNQGWGPGTHPSPNPGNFPNRPPNTGNFPNNGWNRPPANGNFPNNNWNNSWNRPGNRPGQPTVSPRHWRGQ